MRRIKRRKLSRQQQLSVIMAAVNGMNSFVPLAPGLAAALAESPLARRETLDEAWLAGLRRGGQILDSLLFTTAYAAYTGEVTSDTTVSGETVDGYQDVYGTTSATVIDNGGRQFVRDGGSASVTTVNNGGSQFIMSGGSATGTTVNRGGTQSVSSGGSATVTTVNAGGIQYVHGKASNTTLNSGQQYVAVSASATSTTINSDSWQTVYGSVSGTTVNAGGTQTIGDSGSATVTTVNAGGVLNLWSGGSATAVTLQTGYVLQADTGATLVVNGGAVSIVSGHAANITLNDGGRLRVSAGHDATGTTINFNGWEDVFGTDTAGTIMSGGLQTVYGTAVSTTVNSGGEQYVSGSVSGVTVNAGGLQSVETGGTASGTTVNSGGALNVWTGGSAVDTTLREGYVLWGDTGATLTTTDGAVTISNGQANGVTLNGGYFTVLAGNTATSTTVNAGGTLEVSAGGSAVDTTLREGYVLTANTDATLTTIDGSVTISNGLASSVTLNRGGRLTVLNGHTAENTTVNAGGTMTVLAGGTAFFTGIVGGSQDVFGRTELTAIQGNGTQTVYGGGVANGTFIDSGAQIVANGGSAQYTTVNAGGTQTVLAGGQTSDTTVNGGRVNIEAGAVLAGSVSLSGGTVSLLGDGAFALPFVIADGGSVMMASGTTVGRSLTIARLSGTAHFTINTDLAAGTADRINLSSASDPSANTIQVKYDPVFASGQSASGSATVATAPDGNATFTAAASEYGAYTYTPTLTSTTAGGTTTWAVTALTASGESETVRTAGDAATGSLMTWRTENNNLAKRMGELRNAAGEAGMWLRTYRGRQEVAVGGRRTNQQYTALQGGWDKKTDLKDGTLFTGYAVGYLDGSGSYNRGSGDAGSFSAGVYRSWLGKKGHYLDVIAKVGRLSSNYSSYLNDGSNTRVDGDYDIWGASLSAEYGYRRQLKGGWYVEPQAELNFSRLNGVSYTASDGTGIHNDAVNSFVGRLGVAVGRNVGDTHYYGKVSLAREFSARAGITAASGGLAPTAYNEDLKESWLEYAVGLTTKLSNKTDGYLEITRTTGDKAKTPWQFNIGARWSF